MYNIPVLKTLNRGHGYFEETEQNNHRAFVVFVTQDIVQISHNIPNNS